MNHLLSHYRIRKLWPLENGAFRRHLLRLDGETRQFRFGTPVNDNFLDAYADTARRIGTVIYGAFIGPDMYASAELRALHTVGDGMAEAAFVCESAHRHNGLGSALMERIITAAQNRGIHQLHMICARENQAMQRLAEKFGARFRIDQGEVLGEIAPSQATSLSLLGEAINDTTDFVTAVLDWSASPAMPRMEPRRIRHHRG
jgi:RimJ/RimL family protein N-acetyltransferase